MLLAIALALFLGGCGNGEPSATGRPERIVSLSPSATEMLFAVGAGDQVVAVDDQSDFPPEAPRTSLSSYQPNVEAIAGYRPDLVVAPTGMPRDAIGGLRKLGLRVLVQPAPEELRGAFRQVRRLGQVAGHPEAGTRVARHIRSRVEQAIAAAPTGTSLKVFHELDPDLYSAASPTFIGRIYARLGLRNVADPAARSEEEVCLRLGVEWARTGDGFSWLSDDLERSRALAAAAWELVRETIAAGEHGLVVLDELTYPIVWGWIPIEEVVAVLESRPERVNVIVTGRDAPAELIEAADTVTEMTKVKHAYDRGVRAKRGLDF